MSGPFTAQLGRISGSLLKDNLVRDGIDLTFRNGPFDPDLLYLNVTDFKVGINDEAPAFDLDVNNYTFAKKTISDQSIVGNLTFSPGSVVGTVTGPINIFLNDPDPYVIFDILQAGNVSFNGNIIENVVSNQNIVFDPNANGPIILDQNTLVIGNITTSGNINLSGDLSTTSNLIIGDSPIDVVIIQTDLTQDINPGLDLTYDLGSTLKRWSEAHIPDWTKITNIRPESAIINNEMLLGGISNNILALQSNDDLIINPNTDIITIENIKFQDDKIINLLNTPLRISTVGIGYYRFQGTNGMIIPAGTIAERPLSPERGDTRWNTELGYLECFDGTVYITSIGPGDVVEVADMENLGNIYSLILG
jgi:hypothetical protein